MCDGDFTLDTVDVNEEDLCAVFRKLIAGVKPGPDGILALLLCPLAILFSQYFKVAHLKCFMCLPLELFMGLFVSKLLGNQMCSLRLALHSLTFYVMVTFWALLLTMDSKPIPFIGISVRSLILLTIGTTCRRFAILGQEGIDTG